MTETQVKSKGTETNITLYVNYTSITVFLKVKKEYSVNSYSMKWKFLEISGILVSSSESHRPNKV